MPCYQCSHCNKCGMYSIRLQILCGTCGADVVIGQKDCPSCGTPYRNNIKRGMMGKPKGTEDYSARIDATMGRDAYRMVDMSNYGNKGTKMPGIQPAPGGPEQPGKKKRAAT